MGQKGLIRYSTILSIFEVNPIVPNGAYTQQRAEDYSHELLTIGLVCKYHCIFATFNYTAFKLLLTMLHFYTTVIALIRNF